MNELLDQKIRYRNAVARAHSQVISGHSSKLMVKEAPVYSGRMLQLLPIVLANLVLTLLTLGLYRFWAKTRLRRYFLSRVSFLGDPLEYTGTGAELFKGFLVVLVIMVPFVFATRLVQQLVVTPGVSAATIVAFQVGYVVAIYFLYSVAVYRAQRYRLSRSSWRGIRGGQRGSALLYAVSAVGLLFATLATAGLAYPVMRRLLMGYRIRHACFGTECFQFKGGFLRLFAAWLLPWAVLAAIVGILSYMTWAQGLFQVLEEIRPEPGGQVVLSPSSLEEINQFRKPALYIGGLFLVLPFLWIWYRTFEARQWINNTRFGELAFASRLNTLHVLIPNLIFWIALFLMVILFSVGITFASVDHIRTSSPNPAGGYQPFIGLAIGAVILLIIGLLKPIIVQHWLVRNFCKSLSIQGTFSPDRLFQNQLEIPRRGEGLADALDVDAF